MKRLVGMLQQLVRLTTTETDAKALEDGFSSLRSQLATVEHVMQKTQAATAMHKEELASYAELQASIR